MRLITQTPPYIYQCSKCRNIDFGFMWKGNQLGIYCSKCGKWLKWADKDEQNLYEMNKPVELKAKTGHWIVHEKPHGIRSLECPYCNIWYLNEHLIRNSYCPNCGAKMVEPQESEESDADSD